MKLTLDSLQFYLVPGEGVSPEFLDVYNESYRMWRDVWSSTFLELDGNGQIYADDFTRQSDHGAIFYNGECVGLCAYHRVDFNAVTAGEDSYFKVWTPEDKKILTKDGTNVLVCSHLTVAPNYRGEIAPEMTLKLLLSDLSVRRLLSSDCSVMTGTMRNNRGAQKAAYATGASPIRPDADMHGVKVDLVGFYKKEIQNNPELQENLWTTTLWNRRIDLTKEVQAQPGQQKKHA